MDIKLGRLRQWAGEVISSREKTSINEEFAALEKDIELRKEGLNKMIIASEAYHRALTKKETSEALEEDEKFLPIDTLGIVMIKHGGQFGEDSTFGNALLKLGGAQCKIATLQEAHALTFKDTFLASMENFRDEIKEYESLRKRLDSRKSAADSAAAKLEKLQNCKKERDMIEAQDEMERMKQRYEETIEDLRAYMHAIQENELNQLQELTAFIDVELNFAQNFLNVLKEVKSDFQENVSARHAYSRNRSQTLRAAQYPIVPEGDSAESTKSSADGQSSSNLKSGARHARSNSNASTKSNKSVNRLTRKRTNSAATSNGGTSEEKDRTRRLSVAGWASSAMESVTGGGKSRKNKSDKDSFAALDDSPTESQAGEFGVAGKSSSFRSITRLASKATGGATSKEGSPRIGSTLTLGSRTPGKILKPQSMQGRRKIVRALYDFTGSSDELSFKAGAEIVVLNEVLDDWWMGEVDGQTGLFPTSYTEVAGSRSSPDASVPPSAESESRRTSLSGRRSTNATPKHRPASLPAEERRDAARDHGYITSDADDDDTRDLSRLPPMTVNTKSPVYYGGFDNDSESITTDGSEVFEPTREPKTILPSTEVAQTGFGESWVTFDGSDHPGPGETTQRTPQRDSKQRKTPSPQQKQRTMSLLGSFGSSLKVPTLDSAQQPLICRSKSDDPRISLSIDSENFENGSQNQSSPLKKTPPPPPPPPRRQSQTPSVLPPIPVRKVPAAQSHSNALHSSSTGSLPLRQSPYLLPPNESSSSEYTIEIVSDRSPFDSVTELGLSEAGGDGDGVGRSCDRFRQNPFKPKGMCSNCLQFHKE